MLSRKMGNLAIGIVLAGSLGNLAIAADTSQSNDKNIKAGVSEKMKALTSLILLSNAQPGRLASIAEEFGVSDDDINGLYVDALATRDLYDSTSRDEQLKWCHTFEAQDIPDTASAKDIAPYQKSLAAIDAVVLDAVSANIERLASSRPQAFSAMMQKTESFNLRSNTVSSATVSPKDWVANHKQACADIKRLSDRY